MDQESFAHQIVLLQHSVFFDAPWYVARHPEAAVEPARHFLTEGVHKGYDPGPFFSLQRARERSVKVDRGDVFELLRMMSENVVSPYYLGDYDNALAKAVALIPPVESMETEGQLPLSVDDSTLYGADKVDIKEFGWTDFPDEATLYKGTHLLILLHEFTYTGAPNYVYDLIKDMAGQGNITLWVASKVSGPLAEEMSKYAYVYAGEGRGISPRSQLEYARLLRAFSSVGERRSVLVNTCCFSPWLFEYARMNRVNAVPLLHEMPRFIAAFWRGSDFSRVFSVVPGIIIPSEASRKGNAEVFALAEERIHVFYGATALQKHARPLECKKAITEALGLPPDTLFVLGCGSVVPLKGVDTFAEVSLLVPKQIHSRPVAFLWVGGLHGDLADRCMARVADSPNTAPLFFAGFQKDTEIFFAAADVFLLPSRIDTFPLVNLEAMAAELPVVMFDQAGGASEAHTAESGIVVPQDDAQAMAKAVRTLLADDPERLRMGKIGRSIVESSFRPEGRGEKLLGLLESFGAFEPSVR